MADLIFTPIDKDNWLTAYKLKVKPDQNNFVAENGKSMLQAMYDTEHNMQPYGIFDGETMVGFMLTGHNKDEANAIWIVRFMVGSEHQRKGYGKRALTQFLAKTTAEGEYAQVKLSYVPENTGAAALYKQVGFVEEGLKEEWGEIVASYTVNKDE
ncbi:MAG: GNAT family N-acetyltransferase [Chloroflexota bacterium]